MFCIIYEICRSYRTYTVRTDNSSLNIVCTFHCREKSHLLILLNPLLYAIYYYIHAIYCYFIIFTPKSQYLDNNYYIFNKILCKFCPLLPKTAYRRFNFLYNIPESGEYDKTAFQSSKITPYFATNNYSAHQILPAQKKQGLKKPLLLCFYNIVRPQAGIFTSKELFFLKSVFIKTADGANPVFGDVFPLSSGSNSAIRIAESFVVNVSARTNVFHIALSLFSEISVE